MGLTGRSNVLLKRICIAGTLPHDTIIRVYEKAVNFQQKIN